MPAGITITTNGGAEIVMADKPAWHGLGQVRDTEAEGEITSDICLSPVEQGGGGLGWMVGQRPMLAFRLGEEEFARYVADPEKYMYDRPMKDVFLPLLASGGDQDESAEDKAKSRVLGNFREDTGLFLGTVTDQYQVVQNHELFRFMDALFEEGHLSYESAFSLYGGKKVVVLGRLPGIDYATPNDPSLRYIVSSMSHDGAGSLRFGLTSVRMICANTHQLGLQKDAKTIHELTLRHSGDIMSKLDEAREILEIASARFEQYEKHSQQLAQYRMTGEEWDRFLNILCPLLDKADPAYTDRRQEKLIATREALRLEYLNELNDTAPRTAWAAFNAATRHVDHMPRRGKTPRNKMEARFNVCMSPAGTGFSFKQAAFETACNMAGVELSA